MESLNTCSQISLTNIGNILYFASCTLMKPVVLLLMSLAWVSFIWGIIQYFLNPDNEEKRKAGKSYLVWGLIAIFVITSIWGLVGVFSNTFETGTPVIPQLPHTSQ